MIVISATDSVQTDMLYMGVYNVATASQFSHAYVNVLITERFGFSE